MVPHHGVGQNVGIGTDTPDQKLEVNGNIKLGDNIMVEGSDTYKVYRNLATYYAVGSQSGAFVIRTNQPTGSIWSVTITGHIWGSSELLDITIAGSSINIGVCHNNKASEDIRVRVGSEGGLLVFIIGEITDSFSYPTLKVTEFTQAYGAISEAYADGWTISQETSLGSISALTDAANVSDVIWRLNGSSAFYDDGNIGIGTADPSEKLHLYGGDMEITDFNPFIFLNDTNVSGGTAGLKFVKNGEGRGYVYYINDLKKLILSNDENASSPDLVIDSLGNIGIGTPQPVADMHIVSKDTIGKLVVAPTGSMNQYAELHLSEDKDNTYGMFFRYDGSDNYLKLYGKNSGTIYGPHLLIGRSTGNMSIGDVVPTNKLEVDGSIKTYGDFLAEGPSPYLMLNGNASASNTGIGFKDESSNVGWIFYDLSNNFLKINADQGTGSRADLVITSTGRIGLGTNFPDQKLEVIGNIKTTGSLLAEGSLPYLYLETNSSAVNAAINFRDQGVSKGWIYYNKTDNILTLNTDPGVGTRRDLVVNGSGDVGIGTDSPNYKLEVSGGSIKSGADLITAATDGVINVGGAIDANSNVIADATTPAIVTANGDEDLYIEDDLELGANGQGYKPGGGSWAAVSDARLKKDITPFEDGLTQLLKIKPVSYSYNGTFSESWDNGKRFVGVVAQDIREIAPYMVEEINFGRQVSENEDGTETVIEEGTPYLTFDGTALTYMLINSVKEQQAIIEKQQEQIDRLTKQVEDLVNSK